ncbi:MAG TPA: FAD-dependent oxidoreductase [Syntrophorhabdaceae bacterium]|nr:FAD-dependent oxidoreductase [Syntrophorhabdaceae bacterium]
MQSFSKLLEPSSIGKVKTKNRIIKTAAGTSFWSPGERRITDMALAYYEAVARGGAGLIMMESPIVEYPFDEPGDIRMRIDDDRYIPQLRELTDIIHKYECPTFIQFYHRGPWNQPYAQHRPRYAASAVKPTESEFDFPSEGVPRELTLEEIAELVQLFARFTERAKAAGFDGVELNAGGDHLFSTFLSRRNNKRTDEYGCQSMANRGRFLVEMITAIKTACGKDYPVSVLFNALEGGAGDLGMTFAEARELAPILEKAGADTLHVRSHWFGHHLGSYNQDNLFYPEPFVPLESFPKGPDWSHRGKGVNVPGAYQVKQVVGIPVITVSGIEPILGEELLQKGKVDFIGMCRPLFADPELPNKLAAGRFHDVAPCTRCSTCQKMNGLPKECRVNAALGTTHYEITKASVRKKVLIVGGGPAGMEAARVSALRGHDVTLIEKSHTLGGSLPVAALVKGTEIENLPGLIRYLQRQVEQSGAKILTGREFVPSMVDKFKPDVAIIAAGGVASVPQIRGIDSRNVVKSSDLHNILKMLLRFVSPVTLRWLTRFWMPVGKNVIIIGGRIAACQLGEFLVKRGRRVSIVDTDETLGEGLVPERKNRLFWWFRKREVPTYSGVTYREISQKGLTITTKEGKEMLIAADTIIPATPLLANKGLAEAVRGKVKEVHTIGDCKEPKLIPDAIADGWRIAREL